MITSTNKFLFVTATILLAASPELMAQTINASSALAAPTTSSGLSSGLAELLRWAYLLFKVAAIAGVMWGSWEIKEGHIAKAILVYAGCAMAFFAPTIVDLLQNLGKSIA